MASVPSSVPPLTKMEFAVQMTCQRCVDDIKQKLDGVPGIESAHVDLNNELVLVTSTLPSATVTSLLEETGKLVVFRGYGGATNIGHIMCATGVLLSTIVSFKDCHNKWIVYIVAFLFAHKFFTYPALTGSTHHGAAVSALRGSQGVQGLVRMTQLSPEQCVIDGTLDGLTSGTHDVKVHLYGDITQGCDSCGEVYPGSTLDSKPAGNIGSFTADDNGRATFQLVSDKVKVWDIIGRSVVVRSAAVKGGAIMCGIIARSSGLFQNNKKVCTCDGTTIWEEAAKHKL